MIRPTHSRALHVCLGLCLCAMLCGCGGTPDQPPSPEPQTRPTTRPTTQPATDAAAGLAALPLKLPKPVFRGTPKNIPAGTTVAKPTGKPRPAFLAPPGVKNVALGRAVTSSDMEPIIGELKLATDGDKEAEDGRFVELGPMVQWLQVDLGTPRDIHAVCLWHYHLDPRVYRDVIVQVADDADFITNVRTLFNNDQDNSAGRRIGRDREYFETYEGKLIDARTAGRPARARYVRLYSNGSTASEMNHYTEVEVWGTPGP